MARISLDDVRQIPDPSAPPAKLDVDVQAYVRSGLSESTGYVSVHLSGVFEVAIEFSFPCFSLSQARSAGEIVASHLLLVIEDIAKKGQIGSVELRADRATIDYAISVEGLTTKETWIKVVIDPVDDPHQAYRVAGETIRRICTDSFNARDGVTQNAIRTFGALKEMPPFLVNAITRLNG